MKPKPADEIEPHLVDELRYMVRYSGIDLDSLKRMFYSQHKPVYAKPRSLTPEENAVRRSKGKKAIDNLVAKLAAECRRTETGRCPECGKKLTSLACLSCDIEAKKVKELFV